ncbi:MAG: phospholipase D family protein, partial [Firmicutes bacterium]|nr:phospholipase D family protein [Bacillota bacterium]
MLSPNERHLYMEALKPPAGYFFDRGVATTFSLDLITLLVAPLSFALFECKEEKEFIANPIAVLEALRRAAGKLAVFCQRGRISIPSTGSLLYSYLERMVVEVTAPNENGVFHPKIWLLRYTADDHPVIYRLLCLSRNITFDRSWDTLLVLEGEVSNKKHPGNQPLADFIRYLPELAGGKVLRRIRDDIELLANEVMQVAFTPPPDFDQDIRFWPIGLPGLKSFPLETSYNRLLIISPFLSEDILTRFNNKAEKILISRVDSLDTIDGNILAGFQEVFIMDDLAAEPETADEDNVDGSGDAPSPGEEYVEQRLTGLHAKLYLAENGRQTRLWTGSANATNAAFNHVNVEFLVELSGNKSKIGIDRFLGRDDSKDSFRNL